MVIILIIAALFYVLAFWLYALCKVASDDDDMFGRDFEWTEDEE